MYMKVDLCQLSGPLIFRLFIFLVKDMKFYLQYIFSYINFKPANVHMFNYVVKPISLYRIIPNRGAVRQGNGLEIHNLETELILPVF